MERLARGLQLSPLLASGSDTPHTYVHVRTMTVDDGCTDVAFKLADAMRTRLRQCQKLWPRYYPERTLSVLTHKADEPTALVAQ